jgi:hypothetical protein
MPGGDGGDAAGSAEQAARAAGYRAGHADGAREGAAAAEAEAEEQMADLLVCLGEEDRKIERLRALLEERGVDTEAIMAELEEENEARLRALVGGEDGNDLGDETRGNHLDGETGNPGDETGGETETETSFASSVHFMADASAMPPPSAHEPNVHALANDAGGLRVPGGAPPDTPTAGGARVLQDISLPDIPAFDADAGGGDAPTGGAGGGGAGEPTASGIPADDRFDEWNMSGEIAREGEAGDVFSPGGWDLNSPLVGAEWERQPAASAGEGELPGEKHGRRPEGEEERPLGQAPAPAPAPAPPPVAPPPQPQLLQVRESSARSSSRSGSPFAEPTAPGPFGAAREAAADVAFFDQIDAPAAAQQQQLLQQPGGWNEAAGAEWERGATAHPNAAYHHHHGQEHAAPPYPASDQGYYEQQRQPEAAGFGSYAQQQWGGGGATVEDSAAQWGQQGWQQQQQQQGYHQQGYPPQAPEGKY